MLLTQTLKRVLHGKCTCCTKNHATKYALCIIFVISLCNVNKGSFYLPLVIFCACVCTGMNFKSNSCLFLGSDLTALMTRGHIFIVQLGAATVNGFFFFL